MGTIFIGITLIIVISPTLFTLPSIFKFWDFSKSGQIGDTICGITAPFINLLGAILVYLSFSEQIEANKNQRKALENEIKRNNEEMTLTQPDYTIHSLQELTSLL